MQFAVPGLVLSHIVEVHAWCCLSDCLRWEWRHPKNGHFKDIEKSVHIRKIVYSRGGDLRIGGICRVSSGVLANVPVARVALLHVEASYLQNDQAARELWVKGS